MKATQEAVDIRRKLAQDRPKAFLPDLAAALNNLGIRHSALGQREAAMKATQEATGIYRKLAAQYPDVFAKDLRNSEELLKRLKEQSAAKSTSVGAAP